MRKTALSLAFAVLVACGGARATSPTPPPALEEDLPMLANVPAYFEGFYVEGADAPEAPGSMHILILSWGDDVERIARALQSRGARAFVSVHCCAWDYATHRFDPTYWERIEGEWLAPLRRVGVLAGIYVVDEPTGNGFSDAEVGKAANYVHSKGYPTMAARTWGNHRLGRLPGIDYYSVVIYSWHTKKEWARDYHRTADTDWIVGQAFDAGPGYETGIPDQAFWRETARQTGKGIISWVWRWPGQYGCSDDPDCRGVWGS